MAGDEARDHGKDPGTDAPEDAHDPHSGAHEQDPLFDIPDHARRPRARVIILTGPSGSGKSSLSTRTGMTSLSLDHFYRDDTDPDLPRLRDDLIDWDDPRSWHADDAFDAIVEICRTGEADIPIYDIPTNRRTGTQPFSLDDEDAVFIAEGIFAAELVHRLEDEGLLADAICIARRPARNWWFRLLRDMGEARKPVPVLMWRGLKLAREEPEKVKLWITQGCRPVDSLDAAAAALEAVNHAEQLRRMSAL